MRAEISNRNNSLTGRDLQITTRDAQIGNLQKQSGLLQQTISDLLLQLGKAQQTEPLKLAMYPIPIPAQIPQSRRTLRRFFF